MKKQFQSLCLAASAALLLAACVSPQIYPTVRESNISLRQGDLEAHGIAFITPSAATGQEEEKQSIALIFAQTLKEEREKVRVLALAETLSSINQAGLADEYKRMYEDYRDTGLFKLEILRKVGQATGTRYLAQIKVQSFEQGQMERLGMLGLRIIMTNTAKVRLFFQIWDSSNGTVAWEATQELHYSYDTLTDEKLNLPRVVGRAAQDLVAKLP